MNTRLTHTHFLSPPSPLFQFPSIPPRRRPTFASIPKFNSFSNSRRNSNFKVKVSGAMDTNDAVVVSEDECGELVVEACLTHTLPPALTLEHGLESLKEAVQDLKLNPPSSTSGMIRFQVAVPPSTNAFNWFCSQPESLGVFPQFYISKELEGPTHESAFVTKNRGVFGIGAAVDFKQSSSSSGDWNSFRRYLLVDSLNITAYGLLGIKYDDQSTFMKRETGSSYFVIPQIELNEYEGFCMLAGTLAWGNSFPRNFDQALHSYEVSLFQATEHVPAMVENYRRNFIQSTAEKFNMAEMEKLELIYVEAPLLGNCADVAASVEMRSVLSSNQFCFRISPRIAVSVNMLDHAGLTSSILQDCANINSVWASLIVEECCRLGLTYFCIAPGSRSSPLAVAASTHPHITCIACYDERSLAFHAIGYARGSQIPAVVITTSGTAVSNLFPAVVEASQDFVPLVLFTGDRPPELLATGANQAIDQVNHFGSYVRFFFNLPAPTDDIAARMVLTTVDSAVSWATCSPYGPVHVNCSFREPLENSPQSWKKSCLDGLDFWISSTQPFTKYINAQASFTQSATPSLTAEIVELMKNGKRGLLVIGAIHREDEIWAALLLVRHLSWPVVTDILSGLRLRKLLTSYPEYEENYIFLDHFDHVLLCNAVREWVQPDVIVQVGSKITSKRISTMLEECFPCPYIMVDKHPHRHDPSHIVSHRIQSSVTHFAGCLLKGTFPRLSTKWTSFLQAVNSMVAWELSFHICSEYSLTEPHVSYALSDMLVSETALFIGNSMPIRDADMYAQGTVNCTGKAPRLAVPCHGISVAGNRGASGIDGLLSTATGFAVGCKKRVLCLLGDVSFLHDTNGLAILSSRVWRKPVTLLVINNRGGGIFSFLPIAKKAEPQILEKYFYYNHTISISKLCEAHGVKHLLAETKLELQEALSTAQQEDRDYVIEVASSINSNATFHSILRKYASQAASHTFTSLSQLFVVESAQDGFFFSKIAKLEYSLYGINLTAPPTSAFVYNRGPGFLRQGFILKLTLDDGSIGLGEMAPLEIHEDLQDVEEQLQFLLHALRGATVTYLLPMLRDSFSLWISRVIGIPPHSIYPSVRCGLEMAILNAIASRKKCTLLDVLWPRPEKCDPNIEQPSSISICALVDSGGTPAEVADVVFGIVEEGFRAVKLKVARRDDPRDDAAVIKEVRRRVGTNIELRVDANRKWTYEEAIVFGSLVKDCNLEYIEEPVQCEDDIVRFCDETGLPVALDETIDNIHGSVTDGLARFTHPGIVALVIKPGVVGGFENAAVISLWAHAKGKLAVVSSAFESSLSLSSYVQFACYLEVMRSAQLPPNFDKKLERSVAHGLGTYKWLKEDVAVNPLVISRQPHNGYLGASVSDTDNVLRNSQINLSVTSEFLSEEHISTYEVVVELQDFCYWIKIQEAGEGTNSNVLLFLHGFLGSSEDWVPMMKSLSRSAKCISVDLPGHGGSKLQFHDGVKASHDVSLSIEVVAAILSQLIDKIARGKVTLVGYSMGARIALYMALRFSDKINGAIVISGSPGLKDLKERKIRTAKDDSRARSLLSYGLSPFLNTWYQGDLWQSFREHPSFKKIVARRLEHDDIHGLAKALSDLSIGRQPSLWEDLEHCEIPLLFIVGEKDVKFKNISRKMGHGISGDVYHETVEVPDCGHAVHLENPLAVVRLLRQFLTKTSK